jgi:hypothetical protein
LEEFVKQALGFLFQHFVAHDFEEISRETNTFSMYYAAWRLHANPGLVVHLRRGWLA